MVEGEPSDYTPGCCNDICWEVSPMLAVVADVSVNMSQPMLCRIVLGSPLRAIMPIDRHEQ